jgi:hypothetical protein
VDVDAFEEFEKLQANGIALRGKAIAAGVGKFVDQVLGPELA